MDNISKPNFKLTYEELLEENIQIKNQVQAIEEKLKKVEDKNFYNKKYRHTIEKLNNSGSWELDLINNKQTWSENYCFLLGYDEEIDNPNEQIFLSHVYPEDLDKVKTAMQKSMEEKIPTELEFRYVPKDGTIRYARSKAEYLFDEKNNITKIIGSFQDITEKKQHEGELIKNQYYLSKAQEIGKIGTWERDIINNKRVWTKQNYDNFGLKVGTPLTDELFFNCIHPEDREYVNSEWAAAIKGNPYDIEHRVVANGKVKWLRGKADIKFDENGIAVSAIGFSQDITKFKVAEQNLKESEKQYKTLFKNIIDEIHYWKVIKDENGEIKTWELVDVNPSALKAWNKTKKQVIGKTVNEIFDNDTQKLFLPIVKNIFKTGKSYSWETFSPATKQHLSMDSVPIGEFFISTGRDITIRKKEEQELIKAEEQANSSLQQIKIIQANTPNVIWKWDIDKDEDFKNSYISEGVDEFFALPKGSIGNSMPKFLSYILPEYLPLVDDAIKNAIKNPNKLISIEYEVKKADGKLAWFSSSGKVIHENGKLTIYGSTFDITEKKHIEQKLIRSDRVFNLTLDMFCIAGFDGYFKYLNPAWERTLGYSIEELLSKPWLDFVHPDDANNTENIKSIIVDGKEVLKFENRYICKDGSIKWLSWTSQPFPKENIMIGAAKDITEAKKIENELIKAKEKAEESTERFKDIAFSSNDWIWELNNENKYIYVSEKIGSILGYEPKEIIGTTPFDLMPESEVPKIKSIFNEIAAKKEKIIDLENCNIHRNGQMVFLQTNAVPIIDKAGNLKGYRGVDKNITERKNAEQQLIKAKEKAEESEKQLKYSQKVARIGYYILNIQTGLWTSSEMLDEIFGINKNYIRDVQGWLNLIHPDFQQEMLNYFSVNIHKNHETFDKSYQIINIKTGHSCWVHGLGTLEFDNNGNLLKMFGTIQDISKSKSVEQELIEAKEKAEDNQRLKSAFLANMSHEIRTPMNGILGFTLLLQEADLSVENQKEYIDIIQKSGNRLLSTVNDIIEISKIESGEIKVTKSEVDIIGHLDTQVAFFRPEAKKKNIDITVQNNINGNNLTIETDKNKLNSIVSNLIKNAIKYTNKGTINVGLKIENDQILFSCKDTGIGIPKSRQEAIFNRFEQADIEDKQAHQGSGLGLSIVKTYVEILDGKIWLESEEGLGSTFYVSLPYEHKKKEEQIIQQEIKSSYSGIKNINVLIVEDDDISSMHLLAIIKAKVKNIRTAKNGIEAIDILKNDSSIDLILMDLKMPRMDGIQASIKIREFNKDVVIIAQTANAFETDKQKALNAGCNGYISKPIKKDILFELINKYF
jgi:PAS domain S-box-containing protein